VVGEGRWFSQSWLGYVDFSFFAAPAEELSRG
jgi:hypothetical protein